MYKMIDSSVTVGHDTCATVPTAVSRTKFHEPEGQQREHEQYLHRCAHEHDQRVRRQELTHEDGVVEQEQRDLSNMKQVFETTRSNLQRAIMGV